MKDNINKIDKKENESESNKSTKLSDYAFKFPLKDSFSKIEIPFSFQNTLNDKSKGNNFNSYIKIQDTPILYLDISNDDNIDKLFLNSTIETLKNENKQHEINISNYETQINNIKTDIKNLQTEIIRLKDEYNLRNSMIQKMHIKIKQTEDKYNTFLNEINKRVDGKVNIYNNLKLKFESFQDNINKNNLSKEQIDKFANDLYSDFIDEYSNSFEYLKNKFNYDIYSDSHIYKSLQLDLLDYQAYVKEQIKLIKPKVYELINKIQSAVTNSLGNNYEIKVYGSHATNLCLPWSDLDVVIVNKNEDNNPNNNLLIELYQYLKDNQIFSNMNYIGTTTVPLIKVHNEENMSIDISLESNIHYGIKCVDLVLQYIKKYEVLIPIVLALKNILKNADLNNPYTV